MQFRFARFLCYAIIVAAAARDPAFAQGKKSEPTPKAETPKIDAVALSLLIKSSLMALQHANQTGNYSVLRDLGTPAFREKFDQARLTATFANLRGRGINLNPILVLAPTLTKQPELVSGGKPELTNGNMLHVVGTFPTQPLQIQYELWFVIIDGKWRIEGISADAVGPTGATAGAAEAAAKSADPTAKREAAKQVAKEEWPDPQRK